MSKKWIRLLSYCILIVCLPTLTVLGEQNPPLRSNQLVIGLFTPDLFEGDEIFDEAVASFREAHPQVEIKFQFLKPQTIALEVLSELDLLFIKEGYPDAISETAYVSASDDFSKNLINFRETPLHSVIQNDLFPLTYLTANLEAPLYFCPVSISSTVLALYPGLEMDAQKAGIPLAQLENPSDWKQFSENAAIFAQTTRSGNVFLLEDQFSSLPTVVLQVAAYLHVQASANQPIDEAAIIANLESLKQMHELTFIGLPDIDSVHNSKGVLTSSLALYQSGEKHYTMLPPFSADMPLYPGCGVLAAVPAGAPNREIGIAFLSTLLSKRCQSAYNVMGVIRKDIGHEMLEDYEAFLPPQNNNEDIYRTSLQYAAFPYLNASDAAAYQAALDPYLTGNATVEATCSKLLEISLVKEKLESN